MPLHMQDHLGRAVYFRLNVVVVRAVGNARLAKVAEDWGGRPTPRLWREQRA